MLGVRRSGTITTLVSNKVMNPLAAAARRPGAMTIVIPPVERNVDPEFQWFITMEE